MDSSCFIDYQNITDRIQRLRKQSVLLNKNKQISQSTSTPKQLTKALSQSRFNFQKLKESSVMTLASPRRTGLAKTRPRELALDFGPILLDSIVSPKRPSTPRMPGRICKNINRNFEYCISDLINIRKRTNA